MAVDPASSSSTEYLRQKKKELEDTESNLIVEKARLERQRLKDLAAVQNKTSQDLVQISKEGETLLEKSRSIHRSQVQTLNDNSNSHFQKLSQETAQKIKDLDARATDQLLAHQRSGLEKVKSAVEKAEDPFYRQRSFDANITEKEAAYEVKIKLPQHEAQNLFVSSEANSIKFSLARSYGNTTPLESGHENRTSSYQTIVETYKLPTHIDPKKMQRDYKDGVLTISIGKLVV